MIIVGKQHFENQEQFEAYCGVILDNASVFIEAIAATVHNLNKEWCDFSGNNTHELFHEAPDWQRESVIEGVKAVLRNPNITVKEHHEVWMKYKKAHGWTYGRSKDANNKKHPCLVPYHELPFVEKWKNRMFIQMVVNIVKNHAGLIMFDDFVKCTTMTINTPKDNENKAPIVSF